jgi:hypothetical protein
MDAILAIIDAVGQLLPPKDERQLRWYRAGCFVILPIVVFTAFFLIISFFAGAY